MDWKLLGKVHGKECWKVCWKVCGESLLESMLESSLERTLESEFKLCCYEAKYESTRLTAIGLVSCLLDKSKVSF